MSLVLAVGIDIVQVGEIRASLDRFGPRYTARIFTVDEVRDCNEQPQLAATRFAARFAAKEAVLKALRPGEPPPLWREIEVRRAPSGVCTVALHGAAESLARRRGISALALSMSHEAEYVAAVAVAEGLPAAATTSTAQPPLTERDPRAMSETNQRIRAILRDHGRLALDAGTLSDDGDLYQAGMTSHASVNVMLALEGAFDVEFPDRMLRRNVFQTIASVQAAIEELTAGRQ